MLVMKEASVVDNSHREPLRVLLELTEVRVSTGRPFCRLLTALPFFQLRPMSRYVGRELMSCTFLGPFLSISVFAEDDPKVPQKIVADPAAEKGFIQGLKIELESMRVSFLPLKTFIEQEIFSRTFFTQFSTIFWFADRRGTQC